MRSFVAIVYAIAAWSAPASAQPTPARQKFYIDNVFSFATNGTISENLAVRSNGNILFTISSPAAEVWEVDPRIGQKSARRLVGASELQNSTSSLGITEVGHDVFAFISGDFYKNETFSIHTLTFDDHPKPTLEMITDIPEALLLNGLTTLDADCGTILAADSVSTVVYRIDIKTGEYKVVLQDKSFDITNPSAFQLGVNGLRKLGGYLYYTNTNQRTYSRVKINQDGTTTGPFELISDLAAVQPLPDDFAILPDGSAYVVGSNEVIFVDAHGRASVVAGAPNAAILAGLTSAQFGRTKKDAKTLYVSSSGGSNNLVNGTFQESGFVYGLTFY